MKIPFLISLVILTSCSLLKKKKLSDYGYIEKKDFCSKINFVNKTDLPIIRINVNGVEANFLFDTGASSNVISPELASKLNLETLSTGYATDFSGKKNIVEYVAIDSLTIDDIVFYNTSSIVADLYSSEIASCFELDGIIGTNLMKKAFWKIQYLEKTISFSDNLSKLKTIDGWYSIEFTTASSGTPIIEMEINNQKVEDLIIDTGYNGYISLSKSVLYLLNSNLKTIFKIGETNTGLYGLHKSDTTYYSKFKKINIGDNLKISNQIIQFNSHLNLVGSNFLENYETVFDWDNNNIYLKEVIKNSYQTIEGYGFNVLIYDNKLIIGSIFNKSNAYNKLKKGDEIIEINGEKFQNLTKKSLCKLYLHGPLNFDNLIFLDLKIKRDEKIINVNLEKEILLE